MAQAPECEQSVAMRTAAVAHGAGSARALIFSLLNIHPPTPE